MIMLFFPCLGTWAGWYAQDLAPVDAFYFAGMTLTTVGFGDVTPTGPVMKAFCMLYIITGVLSICFVASNLATMYNDSIQAQKYQFILEATEKPGWSKSGKANVMDTNNDGKIDWGEFLSNRLLEAELVDTEVLQDIKEAFDSLDVYHRGYFTKKEDEESGTGER